MAANSLAYYIQRFTKLKQGVTKYGPAPHKAVMLLSVIQGIETKCITSNHILVTPMQEGRGRGGSGMRDTGEGHEDKPLGLPYLISVILYFAKQVAEL